MSKVSRLARLGALTSRVTSSYLGTHVAGLFKDDDERSADVAQTHLHNARRIASELGQLKGAAMKFGQTLAQLADGFGLPDEARAALASLHDQATPVPFDIVRRRVEDELDSSIETRFRSFDPEPLGTASLGQAHAAVLIDGTSVVVKVLHEDIDAHVEHDLAAIGAMLHAGRLVDRPREELDATLAEIKARLHEELDYRREAAHLVEFGAYFEGDPDIRIPKVHPELSTQRVLTMERLGGRPISVFATTGTPSAKQRAGVAIGRAFMSMEYGLESIHADPHPGNYLFEADGRVGIIDFGCVRRFESDWIASYGDCGMAARVDDREACMQAALRIGALVQRSPPDEDALWQLCWTLGKPFRGGPYTMGDPQDDVNDLVAALAPRILKCQQLRSTREMVYLHRGLGGTYQMTRQLRARADWGQLFEDAVRQSHTRRAARASSTTSAPERRA